VTYVGVVPLPGALSAERLSVASSASTRIETAKLGTRLYAGRAATVLLTAP